MHNRIGHTTFAVASSMALAAILAAHPARASQVPQSEGARLLTVSGEGEVKTAPDEARLSAGVVSRASTAAEALDANRRAMNDVFAELKREGIPDRSIQTSEFSVSPRYETDKDGHQRFTGYEVSNNVNVTIEDLSHLGSAIDALVGSGANSMGGVSFNVRDPKPFLKDAREAAIRDAMERAQTYAKAAGVTLGRIVSIGEGVTRAPVPLFRAMNVMAAAPPTPIATGEETISAEVTMSYEIR